EREGIVVHTGAKCIRAHGHDDGAVSLGIDCERVLPEVRGSHLLIAAGRRPNTDDLGLDAAGIDTDPQGFVQVDDALKTSAPGVWALGDVNRRGAFTHTAYNDYEIVAANVLRAETRKVSERVAAYA